MNAPPPELPEGLVFKQYLSGNGYYWIREVCNAEGKQHNPHGPAFERFLFDIEKLMDRVFCLNGQLHNENGPAREFYHPSSDIYILEWFVHGERHNPYGPAVLKRREGGELKESQFFLNDTEVGTEEEFLALTLTSKSAGKR